MNNIVVAFPKAEVAKNVKKILAQSGYSVTAVCTTGAQALSSMSDLQSGIVVCGYRFVDMMYTEVYEYMPAGFQMLLIASADGVRDRGVENLVSLSMPLKIHELLQTIEMMDYTITRRKRKQRQRPKARSEKDMQIMNDAKIVTFKSYNNKWHQGVFTALDNCVKNENPNITYNEIFTQAIIQ